MTVSLSIIVIVVLLLAIAGYFYGRAAAATRASRSAERWHSRPGYYGYYVALWCGLPALLIVALWQVLETTIIEGLVAAHIAAARPDLALEHRSLLFNEIRNLAAGIGNRAFAEPYVLEAADFYARLHATSLMALFVAAVAAALCGLAWARRNVAPQLPARNVVEKVIEGVMIVCSTIAILTTIGIVFSLVFEAARFFQVVSPMEFLFGLEWSPQIAFRPDQVAAGGSFGAIPLFAGTLLISAVAMTVAVPVGLMSAIFLAEYARPAVRAWVKPVLEVLAGIPTVVYGFFAALTVAPFFRTDVGGLLGLNISSESALAAGIVMGIMLIPFVSSLSDDVISAVPQAMRDGSYALGATQSETICRVLIPAALPGIIGSFLLAVSRAIGETMIVVMAAGLSANLTANPFEAVTTVTVQIATLLVGDQEFDSPKTLSAFALGLFLFIVTLCLNIVALRVVQKYREQYE